jgi:RNA polymerase sigma factor (sigma-70 family)
MGPTASIPGERGKDREPSTADLAERAARKDPAAAGKLIERCDPFLRAEVRRRMGPALFRSEGEDVLQMIRLAVFQALPGLRGRDRRSILAWMRKVVRSRLLDWERSRRAAGRSPSRPIERLQATGRSDVAASTPTPSRLALDREGLERLGRAIGEIPARYQELIWFIYREQPSPDEVARFVGKGHEAARKFTARALFHLRRALRDREGPAGTGN